MNNTIQMNLGKVTYPKKTVGSLMRTDFLMISENSTVADAIALLRHSNKKVDTHAFVYIVSDTGKLVGVVSIYGLLTSEDTAKCGDLFRKTMITLGPFDDQEVALQYFRDYDLTILPVVDHDILIGVLTNLSILDVADEEATEDYELMAAMNPSDDNYLETSNTQHAKNRLPWLLGLLVSGMINGAILGGFEKIFLSFPILVTFIPMLTDTGGNAGSQSSTLIIRGLALGQIKLQDYPKVLWKEFKISIIVGLGVVLLTFVRVMTMEDGNVMIATTICLALFVIIILSKTLGGMLPILARKYNMDPALMAAPLITTVVDALGLIAYFSIAKVLLGL